MSGDLGGARGRLISFADREKCCELIGEAVANGATQKSACELMGINPRTYQRWNEGEDLSGDQRMHNHVPAHNVLSEMTRRAILMVINLPNYRTYTPHQIVPRLLDLDVYFASESSFYRVMREHSQIKHRSKSAPGTRKKPEPLVAVEPNRVYSWDITYLMTPIKGLYYYLYMVMDIFSRKIVGWQVHDCESSEHAADLMEDICHREKIEKRKLHIHSDNGAPMKGATLRAKMLDMDVALSYSRPRVSNDNPYSESLFKTVKYHYTFPETPFPSLNNARTWVSGFALWYNEKHFHSQINFVTPNQRHTGEDKRILEHRNKVMELEKLNNPERWTGRQTRNFEYIDAVHLNPHKSSTDPKNKNNK